MSGNAVAGSSDMGLVRDWVDTLAELKHFADVRPLSLLVFDPSFDALIERAARLLPEVRERELRVRYMGII